MKLWYFTANALQQSFIARPAEQAVATLDGQILKNEAV
jgi:hypothetical protein